MKPIYVIKYVLNLKNLFKKKVHLIKQKPKQHDNINYNFSSGLVFYFNASYCKKSKPLQYCVVSISIAFLLASQFFQLEKNITNLVLIIAFIIFGNFVRKPRTSI
jgi:hypothetical protein